jgi:hypothetical protein
MMRKQLAGPRGFPFQAGAEGCPLEGDENEAGLMGKMGFQSALKLVRGGKMDETIVPIVGRPFIGAFRNGRAPIGQSTDFKEKRGVPEVHRVRTLKFGGDRFNPLDKRPEIRHYFLGIDAGCKEEAAKC